jgi:hypothetical protein
VNLWLPLLAFLIGVGLAVGEIAIRYAHRRRR